ncbi:QRFP-like peptide receptor [Aplysia californica]|uniref:QRFP-like peptide receptor n=1 Tax=Aplysia californica TaxID=6500 RepID=A0ABM0JIU6_APLCA|nr:QRFP-like peptide receptor [Aplysia californica]
MRTTTNVFLFSLATADLLLVLVCIPVKAAAFLTHSWGFGEPMCLMVNYAQNVSMICSVLTLTCISFERAIAVVSPLQARTICTMRHAKVVVVMVWVFSFLLALPILFIMEHQEVGVRIKAYWCVKSFSGKIQHIAYELFMLVLMFILPMGVMICTYVIICVKVWRFTDMRADMRSGSCVNPIVYAFLSKNFRQSFKVAVCACVKGKAFVRAYRFSMSIASTRTSAVASGRSQQSAVIRREKSSSSGNEHTQVPQMTVEDDLMEMKPLAHPDV